MTYPGGKGGSGVYQRIINEQPPHDVYIEPFLGGGAVMLAKRPASTTIGIDVARSTIASFDGSGREIICADGISYLQNRRWIGRELVYCDPPYPLGSRRSGKPIYDHEMTDAQHKTLLAVLQGLPCMVQVSSYWNPLYCEALKEWRLIKFRAMTRRGPAIEFLWMNYPKPTILHDWRFVGANYKERERIHKKAQRWAARASAMPELERQAVLSAAIAGSYHRA